MVQQDKIQKRSLGLCMGSNSEILKSMDVGETWASVPFKIKMNLSDFQFVGDSVVYAIGDFNYENGESRISIFLKSLDNGNTWDSLASFPLKQLRSLSFMDEKTGFVAGYDGIYRTSDSGNHWDLVWSIPQFGYR